MRSTFAETRGVPPTGNHEPFVTARIRHCTFIDNQAQDGTIMVAGKKYFEITGRHLTREQFMVISRYLDGGHTITEISAATGVSAYAVNALVESLHQIGAMEAREVPGTISVSDFVEAVEGACLTWGRQLGTHELFSGFNELSLRKEVFLGLILETYHYVKSASLHIATAIASSGDRRIEEVLAQYFVEEYGHGELLLETLEALGMRRQSVERSYPTGGTMAIVHMLCDMGRRNTIAYLAAMAFLEMRPNDFGSAAASIREICKGYGWPDEAMDRLIAHAGEDIEAGHSSLLAESLAHRTVITTDQADSAINCIHDLKHSFDQQYDHVIKYYSNISNHIPRVAVTLSSI
jgi:pyrroloquinoline quinone (PQQ) biosynthesis protein C